MSESHPDPQRPALRRVDVAELKQRLSQFTTKPVASVATAEQKSVAEYANISRTEHLAEIKAKLKHRRIFVGIMICLIIAQNIFAGVLLSWALDTDRLKDLQLVFATYITATLAETGWVIRTIVRSVFAKIDWPHMNAEALHQMKQPPKS